MTHEPLNTRITRWFLNRWPPLHGTGVHVTYIGPAFSEVRIRLPLNWRTYNAVGTIFGGSMYGACDPWFMVMLMRQLGPDFIVWDKSATITFKKPGRSTLTACFRIAPEDVAEIRRLLETERSLDRTYRVDLIDAGGEVAATIDKVIYIRKGDRRNQASKPAARFINRMMGGV